MSSPPRDVHVTLGYYKPKTDGLPPDVDDISIILGPKDMDPREVIINDIRGTEDVYTLEKNGFQIAKNASSVKDFLNEDEIKSVYYPEIKKLITESTGANKVIIFNHLIRSGPSPFLVSEKDYLSGPPGPAPRVHVDQTAKGARQLMERLLSEDDAAEFNSSRWQIINVWRPLKTIQKDPLAIADSTTVPDSDLIPIKRIYPGGKEGENCAVKFGENPKHKWYYLNQQRPDEALIFKQHDSDTKAKARRTPHSSFIYPGAEDLENRESIEVRALVCH